MELLPDEDDRTRYSSLPDVFPKRIPKTKNGKLFAMYQKKYLCESTKIFGIAFGLALIIWILDQLQ
ncbi:MAG: hypothetical protein COA53_06695 [Rhodobacteraceae bacterium]|nr:MAG: hypothetical protein COA53_06695 [Paracoccaceae bacterium]